MDAMRKMEKKKNDSVPSSLDANNIPIDSIAEPPCDTQCVSKDERILVQKTGADTAINSYTSNELKRRYEETLGSVSAVELGRDVGEEDQSTPVTAETVFTKGYTEEVSEFNRFIIIGGGVTICGIAIGLIIYYSSTSTNRNFSPSVVTKTVENLASSSTIKRSSVSPSENKTTNMQHADNVFAGQLKADVAGEIVHEVDAKNKTSSELLPVAKEVKTEDIRRDEDGGQADNVATGKQFLETIAMETAATQIESEKPLEIAMTRSKASDTRNLLTNAAYTDYNSGDFDSAKNKYLSILNQFPVNRDALLGLGAIALNENRPEQAFKYYLELLMLNPNDALAKAAIINMQNGSDLVNIESSIKLLLYDYPEEPYLYFTLGNVYAVQTRWVEAQQAYFDAYRLDSRNPDYALNLAVSLDHIGQSRSALDYYNSAIKLADKRAAGFEPDPVIERIYELKRIVDP